MTPRLPIPDARVRPGGRSRAARAAAALSLLLLSGLAGCEPPIPGRFMSIGTAGTGGIYYVLGGAIANQLSARDSMRRFSAEVSGGSIENINRIRAGQVDLAMVLAVSAYEAYQGGKSFPEPVRDLRVVAPLYPNITHVMVRQGSSIQSVHDLRGHRVSVGPPGSGTEQVSRHVLEAAGLTYNDVQVRYLSFAESSSALQDGAIDAAIISVGYPASAVLEATTMGAARLIPFDGELRDSLLAKYAYYAPAEIPGGVYRGVGDAVPTFSVMNWIVAREDLPGDVVERVLELFSDGRDDLVKVHDMARQIDVQQLARSPIPVHPAAEAWLSRRAGASPASDGVPAPVATGPQGT